MSEMSNQNPENNGVNRAGPSKSYQEKQWLSDLELENIQRMIEAE